MTSSHISTSAATACGASERPEAISVESYRALSPTARTARQAAADEYVRKAQAMRTVSEPLVARSRTFDYAHLAVELANAHTSSLAAAPGLSDDSDSEIIGSVLDIDGEPFHVGYHYFAEAQHDEQVHMVTLGENATPIPVSDIPELIRLLLAAASGACNHSIPQPIEIAQ
nr:hypothetical protein [uncultured Rhodococcus sp.]